MPRPQTIVRLLVAALITGSMGACTVVPAYPGAYYRPAPVYSETYPSYRAPGATIYYESGHRHHAGTYYRDERRNERHVQINPPAPVRDALRLRRDIHRSLGLP